MARRLRIPFLLDAAIVRDETEMARLNNEPAIRRGLSGRGPWLHRLLFKKIHATFSVGERLLPAFEARDDASRARAQERAESDLTKRLQTIEPFERASVATLAQYVAGGRSAVPVGVAAQQVIGRLFSRFYTATPETYKAARVVNAVLSACPVTMLRVLWWKLTGRLAKSRELLWALAQNDPVAIHATTIAVHSVVDSVKRMRAAMRADGPWEATPAQAARAALVAPQTLLREYQGEAGPGCPFRPGTLVLFRLQKIHEDTWSNELGLSRKEWSQCPAHAVVPRLLQDVWETAARARAAQRYRVRRSWLSRLLGPLFTGTFSALNRYVSWHHLPRAFGFLNLAALRIVLRDENLHDTSLLPSKAPVDLPGLCPDVLRWRTADGSFNDLQDPTMGKAGTRFAHNVPTGYAYPDEDQVQEPNPRKVSRVLLTRREFVPAPTLNVLAAAWIQFQVHDWFSHGPPSDKAHIVIPLENDDPWPGQRTMRIGRTQPDTTRADDPPVGPPTYVNRVTHWWDASQLYGSDLDTQRRVRSGHDGKLICAKERHPDPLGGSREEWRLPRGDGKNGTARGIEITGFNDNWWLGLGLFHHLFALEHNAICDSLKDAYPDWDDERLFQTARLINAALIAKIHDVDWVPTVLRHPAARLGLRVSWWGLFGKWVATHIGRFHAWDMLGGAPGSATDHHGAPYAMTEEFVSVYRMHPFMMPEDFELYRLERPGVSWRHSLADILGAGTGRVLDEFGMTNALYSFGRTTTGALVLGNYAKALQEFRMPHDGSLVDLATVDIVRDRERGVPRYNQFRQLLHMPPVRSFRDLNPDWADDLERVYEHVDRIDLMVGLLAEKKPEGFGFSDTTFRIFLLMNGRRLKSDRFFTDDYRPAVYTQLGLDWIDDNDLRSVLLRHYPKLEPVLTGVPEVFGPWVRREKTPAASAITAFCTLVGLLKYGLALSALLVYLPLTTYSWMPGHSLFGNLFSELSTLSAFSAGVFVFLAAWTVMIVEGLIVNGVELRFPKTPRRAYRRFDEIRARPVGVIPRWADELLSVPVTGTQFALFTAILAGPAVGVTVAHVRPGQRLSALAALALASGVAYLLLLLAAAPAAVLDPDDAPLRGHWPGARPLWGWLRRTPFRKWAARARKWCSSAATWLRMKYVLDKDGRIYPAHLFSLAALAGFTGLWIVTSWLFYPARYTAAAVVYVYISLLLFVWFFGSLSFHLGRLRISPLVGVALVLAVGYAKLDSCYQPAGRAAPDAKIANCYHPSKAAKSGAASVPSVDPVEVAAPAKENLVVVAAAGGGVVAAGWTGLGLERLLANRPELQQEIRVLTGVSGGAVGAAFYIDGLLRKAPETDLATTLREVRVRSMASSLPAVAYGMAFRDFPRLITGGFYNPRKDRGQLLEEEWARIAAAGVTEEKVDVRPEPEKGQRPLRALNPGILDGSIPAPIFGTTVMEAGQRLMITPIAFAAEPAHAPTLHEFLFPGKAPGSTPDLDLWTAARLAATFSYISPPVRSWLNETPAQREHLIDGGYYDNFGVTSALDWLTQVLEARKRGDPRLCFRRVLLIELAGFPEQQNEPADGLSATFTGPLTALLALREGIAQSRNDIDLDRFKRRWNEALSNEVEIATVTFQPYRSRPRGPLSWHLSSKEMDDLKKEWGEGTEPHTWRPNLYAEWRRLDAFLRGVDSTLPRDPSKACQATS